MSDLFNSDEEVLARLVREAGDPSVSPDPQYAETLRAAILGRVGPTEAVDHAAEAIPEAAASPAMAVERTPNMKRIAEFAVAATALVALGIGISWMTVGGSPNMAFARVADALDRLRTATYDVTEEAKEKDGQLSETATGKGFFLAPSHQRIEMKVTTGPAKNIVMDQITIVDGRQSKCMTLMPMAKFAVSMDMKKIEEEMKKSGESAPPDLFEKVRRLVREGSSGTGEKAERLGQKKMDGHKAVGFRIRANRVDMTLWADPETARPVRIEVVMDGRQMTRMVMGNFRYDVVLKPSLFSLEPPEGYSTQAIDLTMPVEEDLLRTLRILAEHGKGVFPAKLGMKVDVMNPSMGMVRVEVEIDHATNDKLEAKMDKIARKYGGKEKLRAKYGKKIPPEITAEFMKAAMPLMQKQVQGITFYEMLKPENDPHYVGGGVKLGTPDRPILWYRPTGTDKYRVICADLSVKDMAPDDVKKLPEARHK